MKTLTTYLLTAVAGASCSIATHGVQAQAQDPAGWYVKPTLGMSTLSDTNGTAQQTGSIDGSARVDVSSGFVAGIAAGYQYNTWFSAEVQWEYRSNDSDTTTDAGAVFEGNFASSVIYLNGYYHFWQQNDWNAYLGAGLGWVQEIDIDLEDVSIERSYSGDGDIIPQFMLGLDYRFNARWDVNTEIRYASMSSVDLDGEENAVGTFNGLDYDPLTLAVGVKYRF